MFITVMMGFQEALQEVQSAADSLGIAASQTQESFFQTLISPGNRVFTITLMCILLLGVFLVSMRLYALMSDKRRGARLYKLEIRGAHAETVAQAVETETHHLLSEIFATMLNVFQTQGSAETLHDEVMNFIKQKQDQFASFKLRIDFLSDTAGAIGLLGTVWGIIVVFANDVSDKDAVLAGMSVALTSTLVGLLVSLALNLCVTEVNTYFDRLLDRAVEKADVLRFRLMELANQEIVSPATPPSATSWGATTTGSMEATSFGRRINPGTRLGEQKAGPSSVNTVARAEKIMVASKLPDVPAGATLRGVKFRVLDKTGQPVAQCPVTFKTPDGREESSQTLDDGTVAFDWSVGNQIGSSVALASVPDTKVRTHAEITIVSPVPAGIEVAGNNQSGTAGAPLPRPVGVRLRSRSGKPIPNHPVSFKVEMGGGSFAGNGKSKHTVRSDAAGEAFTTFTLGQDPGFNVAIVEVDGVQEKHTIQAMGSDG